MDEHVAALRPSCSPQALGPGMGTLDELRWVLQPSYFGISTRPSDMENDFSAGHAKSAQLVRRRTLDHEVRGSIPAKGSNTRICGRGDPKLGKGLRIPRIPRHPGIAKVSPLAVQSSSPGCQPIRRWTCGIRSRPEGSPTEEQRIGFRRNSYSPRGNGI